MDEQDRLDIIDVQHLYGHVLDRGLWARLGDVFTDDGIFDPSDVGLPPMRGMDEIREKLIPLEERSPNRCHHATNILITFLDGDGALVQSKYLCNHATGIISFGEYEDKMRRTNVGWRIEERKTRRRALGRGEPAAGFNIDWDALLAEAPARPQLMPTPPHGLSIQDRLDLLALQHLYGHVLDRGLWARIGEVFAEDGIFDPSNVGLPEMRGLTEIRDKLIPLEENAGPERCHHSTNAVVLDAGPDRAKMISKYITSSGLVAVAYGEYEDDVVRTARGWRIACRKTLRRAGGVEPQGDGSYSDFDWDSLLAEAPPRPEMVAPQPPLPLSSADRLGIDELLARYGHMFDNWREDMIGQVFTPDGEFDPSNVGLSRVVGIDALRDKFFLSGDDRKRAVQRAHHTTNVTILSASQDRAHVLSKYIVHHQTAAVAFGEYEDDLVKTADGWRIKRRKTFRRALGLRGAAPDKYRIDSDGRMIRESV